MAPLRKLARNWFTDRFPVREVEEFVDHQARKPLPGHVSWFHTFGSLALFLMAGQFITGILLMVYYRPTEHTAFQSVKFIMTHSQFGWLIRGFHAWGANLMIVVVVLHMFRTFMMGAFKKPRELTWITGVFIFFVTLNFGFTGYLLPWNQLAYWATTVGTEIAGAIPWVGEFIRYLLRGGEAVSEETLSRFYVVHVVVLPWVLVGLVGGHLFLMRLQGLSPLEAAGEEKPLSEEDSIPFFPDHVLKELVIFPIFFLALLSIVILFPPELGEQANPLVTPEGIKPEWYFLSTYQLLKYFPKLLGIFVSVVPMVLLLVWPFLDRGPARRPRERPWSVGIGVAALLLALLFGFLGHFSERNLTWAGTTYHIDMYGSPHRVPNDREGADGADKPKGEKSSDDQGRSASP